MRQPAIGATALVVMILTVAPLGQSQRQPDASTPPQTTSSCADQVSKAVAQAGGDAYALGVNMTTRYYSSSLDADGQRLKISIVSEDFPGADAFQYAAAEVVRTQFSDKLEIEPNSTLELYLTGTSPLPLGSGGDAQGYDVEVQAIVPHRFAIGEQGKRVYGTFVFSKAGGTVTGYTMDQKTQVYREEVYKVLSDFFQQWAQAQQNN
jgi:hypothetical protein